MNSNFEYPLVQKSPDFLVLEFASRTPKDRLAQMPMVLDFDRFGNVIAIELISIKHYGGPHLFDALGLRKTDEVSEIRFTYDEVSEIRLTYDDTCDSSWIVLEKDRSLDQRCVDGRLVINRLGHLVAVEVPLVLTH